MIPVALPQVTFEVVGIEDAARTRAYNELQGTQFARRSVVIATGGERGARENAKIAAAQAAHGRNPFYLPDGIKEQLRFMVRGVASTDPETRRTALWKIGEVLMDTVRANVDAQRTKGGAAFRDLTEKYKRAKRRAHGFVYPILRATGDLLDGLRIRIEDF